MKKILSILFLVLMSLSMWGQGKSAMDQLKEDPRKAYGNDYPYPTHLKTVLTKAPKGYKPFYISHYARHGSRYYWTEQLYKDLDTLLTLAHEKHLLTTQGEMFYNKFMAAKDELMTGVSELTQLGWEQHQSIARNMYNNFPEELVKIDPKSIGVGQYQHDVDQGKLKKSLDLTVESCVNLVGVNVNTASKHLLTYVSGLGPALAQNIVDYRKKNGAFTSRAQLKKVPRLGPSAYEQCAGFLRIPNAKNPLDNSAVHPESYKIVEQMAKDNQCSVAQLITDKERQKHIDIRQYVTKEIGLPTLTDIMKELEKPGRDPRGEAETFEFDERVHEIADLQVGMVLPGIVTNITKFGAFVDIGVHQDGLVHVSRLANKFVSDPNEVVKLHQHVQVKVTEVDTERKRISLSMRDI